MKKSLIALAALATVSAAQAQSSVTVYGIVDTGWNEIKSTPAAATTAGNATSKTTEQLRTQGEAATSRLGFRGTEDLGGGMRANFVAESALAASTGIDFARNLWAGVQGGFGELRIGLQNTGARDVWLGLDQLAAANVVGNVAHSTVQGNAGTAAHTAFNTGVQYITPRVNGLQGSVAISRNNVSETGKADVKSGQGYSFGGSYVVGKLVAAASYGNAKTASNTVAGSGYLFAPAASSGSCASGYTEIGTTDVCYKANADTPATEVTTKVTTGGGSYDFGVAKVAYIYTKLDQKDTVTPSSATLNVDRTSNAFSASAPIGAKTVVRAGYGFGKIRTGNSAYEADIKGMQAAVNYNLSKRTMAYAIYGEQTLERSGDTKLKDKEYSVGVRHSF